MTGQRDLPARLQLSDDLLDHLADLLAPRVRERLERLEDPQAADDPIAYTIASLAESLGVSEKVVRGAIRRGELPAVRRGRRYIIALDDARAWAQPDNSPHRAIRAQCARRGGRPLRDAFDQLDRPAA
jgi:excisionase family DNA binding protein